MGERKFSLSFSLRGTKILWSESLRERQFAMFLLPGANIPYWELSLPKVPKIKKAHFLAFQTKCT